MMSLHGLLTKGMAYHSLSVFLLLRPADLGLPRVSRSPLIDSDKLIISGGQFSHTLGNHFVINIIRKHCFVSALLTLTKTQHQKEVHQLAFFLHLYHTS